MKMKNDWMTYKGMEVSSPQHFVIVKTEMSECRPISKWERKRNELVYKMKIRKALLNWLAMWVVNILIAPITASLWVILLSLFETQLNAVLVGLAIPITWIGTYHLLEGMFQTDSYHVVIKRKGMVY